MQIFAVLLKSTKLDKDSSFVMHEDPFQLHLNINDVYVSCMPLCRYVFLCVYVCVCARVCTCKCQMSSRGGCQVSSSVTLLYCCDLGYLTEWETILWSRLADLNAVDICSCLSSNSGITGMCNLV